jgi:hypothetical protein
LLLHDAHQVPLDLQPDDHAPAALAATLREESISKQLTETQQVALTLGGPDDLRQFLANQMRTWGAGVKGGRGWRSADNSID